MHSILLVISLLITTVVYSQTNTYSPYSRYGLGDLSRQGLTFNKAMGGTGIALRLPNSLNHLNPATFTTQDTLSFLFDFGLYSNFTNYRTNAGSNKNINLSLNHIVFGFPINSWWKISAGLVPYSRMGYNIYSEGAALYNYSYQGTGGINKFYFGNAFKIYDLSVGINLNVLFGSLEQTHAYYNEQSMIEHIIPTQRYQQQSLRSTSLTFGFQYNLKLSSDFSIILGGIYENKSRLISNNELLVTNNFQVIDSTLNPYTGERRRVLLSIDTVSHVEGEERGKLPYKYGAGLSLNYKNKLIVTADYTTQKWSQYQSFNPFDSLVDSRYLNFGIQFTPNEKSIRNYLKRISYRAGFYTNNTYLNINGQQIKDYGVSFGLRLPFRGKSSFQLSYEYGKRGTTNHNLIRENYHFLNLSISLYDFWFVQTKYE